MRVLARQGVRRGAAVSGLSSTAQLERTVVLLAMAGDDRAFNELISRHQARLRSLLRRACGNNALADDVAQVAFLKAWRNIRTLRDPELFGSWLRKIALRAAIDAMRSVKSEAVLDESVLAPVMATGVATAPVRIDLEAAIARLSFPARACVLLFHGEGMSHAEIATETGLPLGTVKSHIARATALLRTWLEDWRQSHG